MTAGELLEGIFLAGFLHFLTDLAWETMLKLTRLRLPVPVHYIDCAFSILSPHAIPKMVVAV